VADVALQGGLDIASSRAKALDRLRLGDAIFRSLTQVASIGVLLILGGAMVSLLIGSLPALSTFGFGFLIDHRWNPVAEKFGALPAIYGTILTSFIAMLIAAPVGLVIAFFLTPERFPGDRNHECRIDGRPLRITESHRQHRSGGGFGGRT
jgi:phosphate transport system permease protein